MDLSLPTLWWIALAVLVVAELSTGTFYLLMLGLGAVAGALAAHAGMGVQAQLTAAALVGIGAVTAWHLMRRRRGAEPAVSENRDVNLDIGERLQVTAWQPDGTASAMYRGARWDIRHAGSGTPQPGWHVIRRVEGNRLHVEHQP